jgi:hypothetical protein
MKIHVWENRKYEQTLNHGDNIFVSHRFLDINLHEIKLAGGSLLLRGFVWRCVH